MSNAPRERWVIGSEAYECEQDTGHLRAPEQIHLIEHSAYEKAKNERNKLDAEFPKIIVQIAKLEQERDLLRSMLRGTLTHTRGCTYDNAPGDEGDFCTCGLAKRRRLCK